MRRLFKKRVDLFKRKILRYLLPLQVKASCPDTSVALRLLVVTTMHFYFLFSSKHQQCIAKERKLFLLAAGKPSFAVFPLFRGCFAFLPLKLQLSNIEQIGQFERIEQVCEILSKFNNPEQIEQF